MYQPNQFKHGLIPQDHVSAKIACSYRIYHNSVEQFHFLTNELSGSGISMGNPNIRLLFIREYLLEDNYDLIVLYPLTLKYI